MDGEISPSELETLLEANESPVLVDIRTPVEFRREHIPESRNIPFGALPREVEQLRDVDHVVTICPHGKASVQAARLITSFEGFDGRVESLESGLSGWEGRLEGESVDESTDNDTTDKAVVPDDRSEAPF